MSLTGLWSAVVTHLWQTSLVLLALLVTARLLRRAPARFEHALWSAGLLKLLIPLAAGSALVRTIAPEAEAQLPVLGASTVWADPARDLAAWSGVEPWLILLTVAWATITGVLLARLARDQWHAWRLARKARPPGPEEQTRLVAALRGSNIPIATIRLTKARIGSAVVGLFRSRILVSESLLSLSTAELRAILEHEDGHRRRLDPAQAVIRRVAVAVFFFFPPIVPLVRRLHESAECAADEHALRAVRADTLARSVARVVQMGLVTAPDPAAAGNAKRSTLAHRFERLSHDRRQAMPIHRLAVVAATVLVLGASLFPVASAEDPSSEEAAFDTPPSVTHQVSPQYPERARKESAEGRVLILLTVQADGRPSDATVTEGIDGYPELGDAAIAAVEQWEFAPAEKDGKAVAAEIVVPFEFRLDSEKREAKQKAKQREAAEQSERADGTMKAEKRAAPAPDDHPR